MARFRFEVKDRQGRRRSGSLEAASHEAAAQEIQARGFEILRLQGEGATGEDCKLQCTPVVETRSRRLWDGLALGLGLLGLLGWIFSGRQAVRPVGETRPAVKCRFEVAGVVTLVPSDNQENIEVALNFPEIPLKIARPWREVGKDGQFAFSGEFGWRELPRQCQLEVSKPGYQTSVHSFEVGSETNHWRANARLERQAPNSPR